MLVKQNLRKSLPNNRPLRQDQFMDKIESGALFGYVQCDIKVLEYLREKSEKFPPNFKTTKEWRHDKGPLMQEDAEKEELKTQ